MKKSDKVKKEKVERVKFDWSKWNWKRFLRGIGLLVCLYHVIVFMVGAGYAFSGNSMKMLDLVLTVLLVDIGAIGAGSVVYGIYQFVEYAIEEIEDRIEEAEWKERRGR